MRTTTQAALSLLWLLPVPLGCPQLQEVPVEMSLLGALDRDSVGGSNDANVEVSYRSVGARAEWWPCDLRLTAQGCVGQHHVNAYITLPHAEGIEDVGQATCVSGDEAQGVYELMRERGQAGEYTIGADINAFVLIASDMDDAPGAVFNDDTETTAATKLTGGKLTVTRWAGLEGIGLTLEATTAGGREVRLDFSGPASSPAQVPTLEGPSTCVESALLEP